MDAPLRTLVVILHGWKLGPRSMGDVERVARETIEGPVEILRPRLGYADRFASVRAASIVRTTLAEIDAFVAEQGAFGRIILVGHSVGATIARRVFLVASGVSDFPSEDELRGEPPRAWATNIDRLVMIAAFSRGWQTSERTGWINAIIFNSVGLVGHIVPNWTPSIFDFRLGAPFMVQTRLHWMAYRNQLTSGTARALVVQLIGTQDDLISPFDQVDISVDGSGRALVASQDRVYSENEDDKTRDYFLVEMPFTDHKSAVDFSRTKTGSDRAGLFKNALTFDRRGMHRISLDPALLADAISSVDTSVDDVVFVIHGIRDDGFWTHRIAERIRQGATPPIVRGWTPTYGYFAMLPFMLPWIRRQKVEWFMDQYVSAIAQYPRADFHFVGHSNGTYLAARSFLDYPAFHLQRVLFAGSVVRCAFDWPKVFREGRIGAFQNICASGDWVVALFPKSVEYIWRSDLGAGGFDGFRGIETVPGISEVKFVVGGHGAGITEHHWSGIADFIRTGKTIVSDGTDLYTKTQTSWIAAIGATRVTVPLGVILLFVLTPLAFLFLHADFHLSLEWTAWRLLGLVVYLALLRFLITRV